MALAGSPIRRGEWIALGLILLLGAALRLGWPGVNSFAYDEARLSHIALQMARGEAFAAVGMPSSTGVPNLPAAAWIFALPYAISADPLAATLFVGLVNLTAVAGLWALARVGWGRWAGLSAALFLGTSPFAVLYSRNIWSQNLLVPLAVAWLGTAILGAASAGPARRAWAIGLHVLVAGFAWQVHFAGVVLLPATLWAIWRFGWQRHPWPLLIGGGVALLLLLPFALQVICCAPEVFDQYRAVLGNPAQTDLSSVSYTLDLGLGRGWAYLALGERDTMSRAVAPAVGAGALLMVGAAGLGRSLLSRSADGETGRAVAGLALVLLLVGPLFFLRHSTPVHAHYLLTSLPALALALGAGARLFAGRRWWGPAVLLGTAVLAAGWSVQIARSLERAGAVETPGGLGTPLGVLRAVARGVPPDAPALLFAHGDDPQLDGEAAVFAVLWWDRPHRLVNGSSVLILPPYPAYLLATLAPFQAWEEIEAAGLASDVRTFDRRQGALPFVMTHYDGGQDPAGFTLIDPPVALADGAQLEGWRVRQVGPRTRLSTLWRVTATPAPGVLHQFHHLRAGDAPDPTTQPLAVTDVPLSSQVWQVGDRVIVMGDFVLDTAGEYWVDVGHYSLPEVRRFTRDDGQGDSIRLGPFTWPLPAP
jgi:hypothetical protein